LPTGIDGASSELLSVKNFNLSRAVLIISSGKPIAFKIASGLHYNQKNNHYA